MNAEQMWQNFCQEKNIQGASYLAWPFGAAPDKLASLVMQGIKTATASAFVLYEREVEPMPKVGDYSVILDSTGEAKCIIQTTKVYVVPFSEVSAKHAYLEGEGDRSLVYWREVHQEFFTNELARCGLPFTEDMQVVCEEFVLQYQ